MANTCLKISFFAISTIGALLSIALAGGGVWCSLKLKEVLDLRNYESVQLDFKVYWPQVLPYVFVAVGVLGLLVACCGFCGGAGSKGCLVTYNVCAVIVILTMAGAGISAVMVGTEHSDQFMNTTLKNVFMEVVANRRYAREKFSAIESEMHCCGANGPTDYINARIEYPPSCCDKGTVCHTVNPRLGCIKVFSEYTKWAFYIGAAGCSAVVLVAVLSICISIALIKKTRSKEIA